MVCVFRIFLLFILHLQLSLPKKASLALIHREIRSCLVSLTNLTVSIQCQNGASTVDSFEYYLFDKQAYLLKSRRDEERRIFYCKCEKRAAAN